MYVVLATPEDEMVATEDDGGSSYSGAKSKPGAAQSRTGVGSDSTRFGSADKAASRRSLKLVTEASEKDVIGLQPTQSEVLRNLHRVHRLVAVLKRYVADLDTHISKPTASRSRPSPFAGNATPSPRGGGGAAFTLADLGKVSARGSPLLPVTPRCSPLLPVAHRCSPFVPTSVTIVTGRDWP